MTCLLPLIAGICLAAPEQFQLRAYATKQFAGNQQLHAGRNRREDGYTGVIGHIEGFMHVPVTDGLTLHYGLLHRSYLETARDRGEESWALGLTWRPFGGVR